MRIVVTFLAALTLVAQPAPAPPPDQRPVIAHESLLGTLWMQTSVEYHAVTRVVYRSAARQLDAALADKTWTAAVEQTGDFHDKPPAVILDIDETVLDNTPYQARQVRHHRAFQPGEWRQWSSERKATAIAGADEFCRAADSKGITVFYVSNRSDDATPAFTSERADTLQNLKDAGFPVREETLLLTNQAKGWTSDKTARRQFLAARYRILMLFGDDLNDFIDVQSLNVDQRTEKARRYEDWWGERWFALPNPTYGSFERALLVGVPNATAEQRKAAHESALRLLE